MPDLEDITGSNHIQLPEQAGVVATPASTYWRWWFESDGLHMIDDAADENIYGATAGIVGNPLEDVFSRRIHLATTFNTNTLSSDALAVLATDNSMIAVAAQSATTDILDTITYAGTGAGHLLVLTADTGDTITITHNDTTNGILVPNGGTILMDDNTFVFCLRPQTESITVVLGTNAPIRVTHSTDNVTTPTDAELDTAFGTPATVGSGFVGTLDDNGAGTSSWLVWSDGSNWWYAAGTKAT